MFKRLLSAFFSFALLGTASGGDRWKARGTNWIALTSDCGSMFAQYRKILEENR